MSFCRHLLNRPKALLFSPPVIKLVGVTLLALIPLVSACSISQDRNDARLIAASVNEKLMRGDFAGIYKEAAPSFRSIGSEAEFVAGMSGLQSRFGSPKRITELAYQTNLDAKLGRTHILIFDSEYERAHARESLMFLRSPQGKMELWRLEIQPVEK